MASNIVEFFGYAPTDGSPAAKRARHNRECPFAGGPCTKTLSDGEISGACTLKPKNSGPVICCPVRLYAKKHQILHDIARVAFGRAIQLLPAESVGKQTGECIAVFGKRWG